MGMPAFVLGVLASRLREPMRRAPAPLLATVRGWISRGVRRAVPYVAPLLLLSAAGAVVGGVLALIAGEPSEIDTAVFGGFIALGLCWTVYRLVPVAIAGTTEAGEGAATAFQDFHQAAATVLPTPTLIWMFIGGTMGTFPGDG